jgi:hypothetical protein
MSWQPISTAPIDCHVLLFAPDEVPQIVVGRWLDSCELWDYVDELLSDAAPGELIPTHWMPLPPSPDSFEALNKTTETGSDSLKG